jgi:hypothetical protein
MSVETIREIIKSLSYGGIVEEIAEMYGASISEVETIQQKSITEIQEEREYLKGCGYIG